MCKQYGGSGLCCLKNLIVKLTNYVAKTLSTAGEYSKRLIARKIYTETGKNLGAARVIENDDEFFLQTQNKVQMLTSKKLAPSSKHFVIV